MVAGERHEQPTLKVWRCWKCGQILARVLLVPGCTVEVKCKCNAMNVAALPVVDKTLPKQ